MTKPNYLSLGILIFLSIHGTAQETNVKYLSDIFEEIILSDKAIIEVENTHISMNNLGDMSLSEYLSQKYPQLPKDSLGKIIVENQLIFNDVTGVIILDNFHFTKNLYIRVKNFRNVKIDTLYSEITDNIIEKGLSIYSSGDRVYLYNNVFPDEKVKIHCNQCWEIGISMNHFYQNLFDKLEVRGESTKMINVVGNDVTIDIPSSTKNLGEKRENVLVFDLQLTQIESFDLWDNKIEHAEIKLTDCYIINTSLLRNQFHSLKIIRSTFADILKIKQNQITSEVAIAQTLFPELYYDIEWDQISGRRLFIYTDGAHELQGFSCSACVPYKAKTDEELADKSSFFELISLYATFYRKYKETGNIEAANSVYRELQQYNTDRYEFLFRSDGKLKDWFKWRLNQLLDIYIGYGTDPAKALVISFYIMLLFSGFYFFFPSEWDQESKKNLIKAAKSALTKNEPHKARKIFNASGHLVLSFINALTLSLNSFVTLGFGTIPTTGLARYMCIIQGFIGWFLLSLFSVALINQVLL